MKKIASTTNPIFRRFPDLFEPFQWGPDAGQKMSFGGVVRKALILTLWTAICCVWVWRALAQPEGLTPYQEPFFLGLMLFSVFAPFALVGLSLWRKTLSPFTAPTYAMLQGVFLGFVAVAYEARFPSVVMQAFCVTFCVCGALACAYRAKALRITDSYNAKLLYALSGAVFYVALSWTLSLMGVHVLPLVLAGRGAIFSVLVALLAAITFVAGFDLVAKHAQQDHPKYAEWHAAFGLSVACIWLYVEGLRIFFKDRVPNVANEQEAPSAGS